MRAKRSHVSDEFIGNHAQALLRTINPQTTVEETVTECLSTNGLDFVPERYRGYEKKIKSVVDR